MNETMDARNERAVELRRLRRLLHEMSKLAEHASLTGSLSDGAPEAVNVYNGMLSRLTELGITLGTFFPQLDAQSGFDRLGVASRLLYGYLDEDSEEDSPRHSQPNIVIGSLGNLGDMEKLRDMGQTLRDNLADLIRGKVAPEGEKTRVQIRVESSLRRAEAAIAEAEAAVAESQSENEYPENEEREQARA